MFGELLEVYRFILVKAHILKCILKMVGRGNYSFFSCFFLIREERSEVGTIFNLECCKMQFEFQYFFPWNAIS